MALLAESLVEEWLNREGYFTIRGVKHGVGEMDLLAVRPQSEGVVVGWHVEVQVSFRPIGYIASRRTDDMIAESGGGRTSIRTRSREDVEGCAREWVKRKFLAPAKIQLRERLWPGVDWSFHLVHGVARYPHELEIFRAERVTCHPFHELLTLLAQRRKHSFSGAAGGDLAEIVSYYKSHNEKPGT
jgi:Holliday junction resolvase-like predicted endonuclease